MGHNVDLCLWLNAPKRVKCPKCGKKFDTMFDDYDTDCSEPDTPGRWELSTCCENCGSSVYVDISTNVEKPQL